MSIRTCLQIPYACHLTLSCRGSSIMERLWRVASADRISDGNKHRAVMERGNGDFGLRKIYRITQKSPVLFIFSPFYNGSGVAPSDMFLLDQTGRQVVIVTYIAFTVSGIVPACVVSSARDPTNRVSQLTILIYDYPHDYELVHSWILSTYVHVYLFIHVY